MNFKDRLTVGLLAGIAGGIAMSVVDLLFTAFGWLRFPYYDWGLSLIKGSTSGSFFEIVVGQIIHIMFAGIDGVVFAYIAPLIPSKNYLLRGWLFGVTIWFSVHMIVNLLGFEPLKPIPMSQLLSDFVTASIYGIVLAEVMHRLNPEKV